MVWRARARMRAVSASDWGAPSPTSTLFLLFTFSISETGSSPRDRLGEDQVRLGEDRLGEDHLGEDQVV